MNTYEDFKPSNVERFGDIPSHWEVMKLSHGFNRIGSGTTPSAGELKYYSGGDVNWLQTGDLSDGDITATSKKITNKALKDYSSLKQYEEGSIAIAMYGATIGKLGVLKISTTTNQACCVLSKPTQFYPRFVFYHLLAERNHILSLAYGGGQPNISQETVRALRIHRPPLPEQETIAHYLNTKTAEINSLVAGKLRLVELFKEERSALINNAVTKGISRDAPLKPSGVEWLGDIPAHWEVKKLKYVGKSIIGVTYSPDDVSPDSRGLLVLRSSNIQNAKLAFEDNVHITKSVSEQLLTREGDVLLCARNGSAHLVGKSAYISEEYVGLTFGAFMSIFRSPIGKFLYYFFNSSIFKAQTGLFSTSTINQLTSETLNNLVIAVSHEPQELAEIVE